uniref:conjugative transposon protein TraN n=1 Tax=Pedobacter schmidteae TaxID=2201271 RepID=UPI0018D55179|nr:conjugative transposon protein TraN [Pedobacter schmidteae]
MKLKRMSIVMMVIMFITCVGANAQNLSTQIRSSVIPLHLGVSHNKTTNLIFPFSIKSIDRGSRELLAQQAAGVENILQVKAATDKFQETNLTVITSDGALYSFLISYKSDPTVINLSLALSSAQQQVVGILQSNNDNEAKMISNSAEIATRKAVIKNAYARKYDVAFKLTGLYIQNDILYFQIEVDNSSSIGYDIEQLRFYTADKKRSKRTSSQEIEIKPVYVFNPTSRVEAFSKNVVVYAVKKFTIQDRKKLILELQEKNGGRHLNIELSNKRIVKSLII